MDAAYDAGHILDHSRQLGHVPIVDPVQRTDPKESFVPPENPSRQLSWTEVPCGPRGLPSGKLELYRNNGDETFTSVTAESGIAKVKNSYPMTAVAADFDGDGWPDI